MKFVGLMTDNGPLYCSKTSTGYYVINGEWHLTSKGIIEATKKKIEYKVVLEDMPVVDYNEGCRLIREHVKETI